MSFIKPLDFIKFCVSQGLEFNIITMDENDELTDSMIVNQDNIDDYEKMMSSKIKKSQ